MVICVKCGREQSRRSGSMCEYDGNEKAGKEHAWEDRGEFIDELHEKLPPFIKERIVMLQKKKAEKQALFNERLVFCSKKLDVLKAAHAVYLDEELPLVVKKKKHRALRPLLVDLILFTIAFFFVFKLFFYIFGFEIVSFIITLAVMVGSIIVKSVVPFLKASRYAESQEFADELGRKWLDNNRFDKVESDVEAVKSEWDRTRRSYEKVIYDAERALAGNEDDLLKFYNKDKTTKNQYLEKIYEGEW